MELTRQFLFANDEDALIKFHAELNLLKLLATISPSFTAYNKKKGQRY